jgi:hypothetical protein
MTHNYAWNGIPINEYVWNDPNPIFEEYTNSTKNSHCYKGRLSIDFLPGTEAFSK